MIEVMVSAIRVLLVDDFAKFREAVREMLSTNHDFQVVGEAADGLEAVHMAEKLQPDLIVLDLNLPSLNGLAAARRIQAKLPAGTRRLLLQTVVWPEELRRTVAEALELSNTRN
jgi:DNA-binding NarL/FixJ family response regulator